MVNIFQVMRNLWIRIALRGVHYSDQHWKLNLLYKLHNPWSLDDTREQFRFEETNRAISEHLGHIESVLEIGSGEGHQSVALLRICDNHLGIDVSASAVRRAKERCPDGTFQVADLLGPEFPSDGRRFHLVTACEVLYYMRDIPAVITRMSELGEWCLVTYYEDHADRLDRYFETIPGLSSSVIRHNEISWEMHWWKADTGKSSLAAGPNKE